MLFSGNQWLLSMQSSLHWTFVHHTPHNIMRGLWGFPPLDCLRNTSCQRIPYKENKYVANWNLSICERILEPGWWWALMPGSISNSLLQTPCNPQWCAILLKIAPAVLEEHLWSLAYIVLYWHIPFFPWESATTEVPMSEPMSHAVRV